MFFRLIQLELTHDALPLRIQLPNIFQLLLQNHLLLRVNVQLVLDSVSLLLVVLEGLHLSPHVFWQFLTRQHEIQFVCAHLGAATLATAD